MVRSPCRGLLPVVLLSALVNAQAQPVVKPDPTNAQATVPALVHDSALLRYRRHDDHPLLPWKEANDTVGRIGGWRAYAREAAASDAAVAK